MKVAARLFYAAVIVSAVSLSLVFLFSRTPPLGLVPLAVAVFWALAHRRVWAANLGFLLMVSLLLPGIWLGVNEIGLLIGGIAALAAWDFAHLGRQMQWAQRVEDEDERLRRHGLRLGGALLLGAAISLLALNLNLQYTFGWGLIFGLALILALSRMVAYLSGSQ